MGGAAFSLSFVVVLMWFCRFIGFVGALWWFCSFCFFLVEKGTLQKAPLCNVLGEKGGVSWRAILPSGTNWAGELWVQSALNPYFWGLTS